ncbi:Neutral amino acid transporter b [Globisporangium polare]
MDRSSSGNSGRGSAETARSSDNSTGSGGEDRPKIVLYSTNNSIDDDDAHSELDLDLYDTEDAPDSWDQQFSIGGEGLGSILSEPSTTTTTTTTTPYAAGLNTNLRPAQAFHQSQMAAQGDFHQSRRDETEMSDTSSRERRRVLTYETMSSTSSQNYRINRMPMDHQPYIRTNFTTQDVGTPSDPYEMLGTPPGDPPSTRPDEMPTLEAEEKQPRTMNAWWVFGIMSLWFIVGGVSLSLNPPAELGYWLNVVGNLYIRAVNCVTLPMAFCQVVVSVSTLTSKNTLTKLWLKTLGIFLGICVLSVLAAIGIAHAFRPLMKEQQSLGLTLTHHKFAFKCPNNKYFLQEPDGSLSCTGNAVQASTTFPWLVDKDGALGLDESVSAVDLTGYIFALFGTYFPNNFVAKLSKDNYFSGLIIATVIGVAVTKSFRGLQSRSNPLLRLVMHIYSSLFSMLDFMQRALFVAMCPMLIGSVLVSPDTGRIMALTQYYCLSAGLLAIVHCLIIVPAVFFLFTKRNPYTWLYRVATPILYAMIIQSAFLSLSVATKAVMRTKEVPPAVFGAIYPPLTALNRCAQAVGLPLVLVFVAAFSGCHIEVDFVSILKLFGVTYIACLGEAELGRSQLAYFLTIWRTICTNEDTPSAILAIATISLLIYRVSALTNTLTNLAIIRMVATTKESKMHA